MLSAITKVRDFFRQEPRVQEYFIGIEEGRHLKKPPELQDWMSEAYAFLKSPFFDQTKQEGKLNFFLQKIEEFNHQKQVQPDPEYSYT